MAWRRLLDSISAMIPGAPPPLSPLSPEKAPEQLTQELEARARDEARREAAWRARRRRYVALALAVGVFIPTAAVAGAGGITAGSLADWLGSGPGRAITAWAFACSLAPAVIQVWRGWGALLGIVLYGAAFAGFVAIADDRAALLLPTLVLVLAAFLVAGALVGYLLALEEDGG